MSQVAEAPETASAVRVDEARVGGVKRVRIESYPGGFPSRGGRRVWWVEAPRESVVNRHAFFRTASNASAEVEEGKAHRTHRGDSARRCRAGDGAQRDALRPAMAPHRLTVVVAARPGTPDRTAFLQPIAETTWCAAQGGQPPTFFTVPVAAWEDTHLREILEVVLATSEAAEVVLLGGSRRPRRAHPSHQPEGGTGSSAAPAPPPSAAAVASAAPQSVAVWLVHAGPDRMPLLDSRPLATLSVAPTPAKDAHGDRITMKKMRAHGPHRFRLGDLLVLVPVAAK